LAGGDPGTQKEIRGMALQLRFLLLGLMGVFLTSCGGASAEGETPQEAVALGPRDGQDLPPTNIERVAVGTLAPDFALQTLAGDTLVLSAFRGAKNVVLVFYRGHW
jgi:hypothetical protein